MKKRDSVARRLIIQGLLKRMETDPFDEITITQICQEAQVVRQTFYHHFEHKRQVLVEYLRSLALKHQQDHPPSSTDMAKNLTEFYLYLPFSRDLLQLLFRQGLFHVLVDVCEELSAGALFHLEIPSLHGRPEYDRYHQAFIASTITCVLRLWVENEFRETPEELSRLTIAFFAGAEAASSQTPSLQ